MTTLHSFEMWAYLKIMKISWTEKKTNEEVLTLADEQLYIIDGSTDRCCIAIVTNDRALLSGSDQPVQNLGRHRILHVRRVNKRSKTVTFA